jgi:hypothetical protein
VTCEVTTTVHVPLADPTAHALVFSIRRRQGDDAALLAVDLLAQRRAERVTTTADA